MNKTALFSLLAVSVLALSACDPQQSIGEQRETEATKLLQDAASTAVGIPAIKNFTEKRQLKMLYELRDQADLVTYSYYVDLYGNLHEICPSTSVGYGMPFSAQFTAPEVPVHIGANGASGQRHQPEPSGIYMPDSTSATWVICLGEDGELQPTYVEPQIIVRLTPFTD
ncbi:MAG: hypothetical protein RIA09_16035 [Hoeflea sp.]|jgi:hypothetical protein|uniref:hypothetical protein n=1 Tax=Hoeflea sp. TaxID=1940281 RepID=UPI0032ED55E4